MSLRRTRGGSGGGLRWGDTTLDSTEELWHATNERGVSGIELGRRVAQLGLPTCHWPRLKNLIDSAT